MKVGEIFKGRKFEKASPDLRFVSVFEVRDDGTLEGRIREFRPGDEAKVGGVWTP